MAYLLCDVGSLINVFAMSIRDAMGLNSNAFLEGQVVKCLLSGGLVLVLSERNGPRLFCHTVFSFLWVGRSYWAFTCSTRSRSVVATEN